MAGKFHVNDRGMHTLHNWMVNYNLICDDPVLISSFAMALFFGFGGGALILPSLAYKYGMKKFF